MNHKEPFTLELCELYSRIGKGNPFVGAVAYARVTTSKGSKACGGLHLFVDPAFEDCGVETLLLALMSRRAEEVSCRFADACFREHTHHLQDDPSFVRNIIFGMEAGFLLGLPPGKEPYGWEMHLRWYFDGKPRQSEMIVESEKGKILKLQLPKDNQRLLRLLQLSLKDGANLEILKVTEFKSPTTNKGTTAKKPK